MNKALVPVTLPTINMASATPTSVATTIQFMDNVGYQVTWSNSGAPIGVLDVQVSQDGTNWSTLGLNITINNNSPQFINLTGMAAAQSRLLYTKTSGTGTMTPIVTAKSL